MSRQARAKRQSREPWEELQSEVINADIGGELWHVKYWNNKYVVLVRSVRVSWSGYPQSCVHLSIHSNDRSHLRDWRDYQRLKNEILGEDWEAVELYPAESRLVDTSNQFHLFAFAPPFKFPFGYQTRAVVAAGSPMRSLLEKLAPGSAQR